MNKKLIVFIALVLIIAGGAFVYNISKAPTKFEKITVAYQDSDLPAMSLIDLADSKGYFKDDGLQIDRKTGLSSISTYLTAGSVDVAQSSVSSVLSGFYNNQDFRLLSISEKYAFHIRIVSRYSLSELSSVKTVGVNRAGGTYQNMFQVLADNLGINTDKVNFQVAATNPLTATLLEKKAIDFGFIDDDAVLASIKSNPDLHIIEPSEVFSNSPVPWGIISTHKIMKTKSAPINKYVESIKKAWDYFNGHKSEMVTFLQSKYKLDQKTATTDYDKILKEREGIDFSVDVNLLKDISISTKIVSHTKNPGRNISELVK